MSRYDKMISLFSCGCHATGDIPTLSRCEEHNGWIVVCHNIDVPPAEYKCKYMTLWQGTLLHSLRRLGTEKFSYIYAYPEHHVMNAMDWMTPKAWRDHEMEMMKQLYRILKPGGYISVVVDPGVVHSLLYQAHKIGFDVKVKKFTTEYFEAEPMSNTSFAYADAKAHFILYKGYREPVPEKGAYILDISGIKIAKSEKMRKKGNRMLTLCTSTYRFNRLKAMLGG